MITVRKLNTANKQDVKTWVEFPHQLYKDDTLWVPQMADEAKDQLDRKNFPFYAHSHADFFMAFKDDRSAARIAVLDNTRYNEIRNERTALFTLFETINDFEVAEALFKATFEWCQNRDMDNIVGPKGFLPADGMGMLMEGFERPPAIGIAYNPPYYHDFMTRLGFERETDFLSGWLPRSHPVDERVFRIAEKVRKRYGFEFVRLKSKKELKEIAPKVIETYNTAFVENWEYVPFTPEEAKYVTKRFLDIIIPELPILVQKDSKIVGFVLIYPDISNAIRRTKGRLFPFGWYYLLREFKKTKWVNGNGAGILPKYQGRGVDAMLITEMARTLKNSRFDYVEMVQIDEGNDKMQREMNRLGVTFDKRHRIYHRVVTFW